MGSYCTAGALDHGESLIKQEFFLELKITKANVLSKIITLKKSALKAERAAGTPVFPSNWRTVASLKSDQSKHCKVNKTLSKNKVT